MFVGFEEEIIKNKSELFVNQHKKSSKEWHSKSYIGSSLYWDYVQLLAAHQVSTNLS